MRKQILPIYLSPIIFQYRTNILQKKLLYKHTACVQDNVWPGQSILDSLFTLSLFCREEQLLSESRNWIRQEDLDARIEEALDNPVPMYVTKF